MKHATARTKHALLGLGLAAVVALLGPTVTQARGALPFPITTLDARDAGRSLIGTLDRSRGRSATEGVRCRPARDRSCRDDRRSGARDARAEAATAAGSRGPRSGRTTRRQR